LVVSNTTTSRPASLRSPTYSQETGGLSGAPLRDMATDTIADMYVLTGGMQLKVHNLTGGWVGQDSLTELSHDTYGSVFLDLCSKVTKATSFSQPSASSRAVFRKSALFLSSPSCQRTTWVEARLSGGLLLNILTGNVC